MLNHLSNEQLLQYKKLFEDGLSKSKRFENRKIHNQDNKFLYHIVRLVDECEQILETHDIDLQRAKEIMKSIRRGEWTYDQVEQHLKEKEITLARLYETSTLPYSADEKKLKTLLLNCLEEHYGTIKDITNAYINWERSVLQDIDTLLNKHRQKLYQ